MKLIHALYILPKKVYGYTYRTFLLIQAAHNRTCPRGYDLAKLAVNRYLILKLIEADV